MSYQMSILPEYCSICFEELGEQPKELECKHRFHAECLVRWVDLNPTCPICRRLITSRKARNQYVQKILRDSFICTSCIDAALFVFTLAVLQFSSVIPQTDCGNYKTIECPVYRRFVLLFYLPFTCLLGILFYCAFHPYISCCIPIDMVQAINSFVQTCWLLLCIYLLMHRSNHEKQLCADFGGVDRTCHQNLTEQGLYFLIYLIGTMLNSVIKMGLTISRIGAWVYIRYIE